MKVIRVWFVLEEKDKIIIRTAIKQKKITYIKLAQELNCSKSYLYDVLNGKAYIQSDTLYRLFEKVGLTNDK